MDLPNELWYNVFSLLTQQSQSKFSCLWNLHNLSTEEIELVWSSNDLWFDTAKNGYTKLMNFLIKAGADVNKQNYCDYTALHWSAYNNHKECVELLIKAGADINIQGRSGNTALHYVCIHQHSICKDIIKLLIKAGADLNIQNNDGIAINESE